MTTTVLTKFSATVSGAKVLAVLPGLSLADSLQEAAFILESAESVAAQIPLAGRVQDCEALAYACATLIKTASAALNSSLEGLRAAENSPECVPPANVKGGAL